MNYNTKNSKILDLSRRETSIIQALHNSKGDKVTNLARLTKTPRTTVEFLLKKLQRRGITEKIKINNHYEWRKVDDLKLATKFRGLIDNLDFYSEVIGKIDDKSIIIEVFKGRKKIIEAASKILKLNPAHRVFYIQCPNSPNYQINKMPKEFVFKFHEKLKKSGIIMEVIAAEGILPYFDKLSQKELESHYGRPIISYLVSNEYIDFDADLIIHNDLIIILNYQDESVILIKNKLLANIFNSLFEFMQNFSQKIDLNKYIKKLIEAKQ